MSEERQNSGQIYWAEQWASNYKKDLEFQEKRIKTMKRMLTILGEETSLTLRYELRARILTKGKDVNSK